MAFTTKYRVGSEVLAEFPGSGLSPAIIKSVVVEPVYTVQFIEPGYVGLTRTVVESEIQRKELTEDRAWEKVAVLCGARDSLKQQVWLTDQFDKETRHQCYQILGKAHVKITDEVKARVRGLIQVADDIEY